MTITRVILAFLLSPLAYILVYGLAFLLFAAFVGDSYGILFPTSAYFLYFLISVPVFLVVHQFYGWTFLSCLGSALIVVIEVLSIASTTQDPAPLYLCWVPGAVAALVYGGVFWLLAPTDLGRAL